MTPIISSIQGYRSLSSGSAGLLIGKARLRVALWLLPLWVCLQAMAAEVRFDMFLGYDNIVPEFSWFPVTFEIQNDGPSFVGRVELSEGNFGQRTRRVFTTELPTGTLKRFTIPMFKSEAYQREWTARLLDPEGKEVSQVSRQLRRRVPWRGLAIGTVPRNPAQGPTLPTIGSLEQDSRPAVARMITDLIPDNPLVLEGLTAFYLSSDRALALKAPQVNALVAWLWAGGHLIVNLEQAGDLGGIPWLRRLLPAVPGTTSEILAGAALHRFATREWPSFPERRGGTPNPTEGSAAHPSTLTEDRAFSEVPMSILNLKAEGQGVGVMVEQGGRPLVVTAPRGRGKITLLAFNAEREPFTSWAHRPWFWASLCGMREQLNDFRQSYSYRSTDGLMGAAVDSTQIRKLPVGWLLLLLMAYLVVIGPFDRWWLKRIRREMLTWITFPCYVVAFSFLIYLIGYRLRAGDTEWNELQIVDLIPFGEQAQWRTRSFGSVYSPSNRRFEFASDQPFASFRSEANLQGSQDSQSGVVDQTGYHFKATVPVPVWTSQLFVHDSLSTNALPLDAALDVTGQLTLNNRLGKSITSAYLIKGQQVYQLKELAPGKTVTPSTEMTLLSSVEEFVHNHQSGMQNLVDQRRQAFGADQQDRKLSPPEVGLFASFSGLTVSTREYDNSSFAAPPGMDLSRPMREGAAILLAWVENHAAVPGFNRFDPLRHSDAALYRLILPSPQRPNP